MRRTWFHAAILVPAVLVAPACAASSANSSRPDVDSEWCSATPILVVQNGTGLDLEIVEFGSSGRSMISIVGQGRTELPIRGESEYHYIARDVGGGRNMASTRRAHAGGSHNRSSLIMLTRVCRRN